MRAISDAQRKKFFANAADIGLNRSRWLLKEMTGKTSTKKISKSQMNFVLQEQEALLASPVSTPQAGDNKVIHLLPMDLRKAIDRIVQKTLKWDEGYFKEICQRRIKKSYPETYAEGQSILSLLDKEIKRRHQKRR